MQECKFCGMPLEKKDEEEVCDFCRNDDGIEMIAEEEPEDEF
ncbi:MAG: hypothetical protein ABIA91_00480 [Patescibacteria group bacterium]